MAKLTVVKVAKRCLEMSEQLTPQLDDPRLQDLRVSIEQARSALAAGQLPRWQVKRLVDTVALAAMLTGKAKLAEQAFGLWMKAGQSISQNPASLVLEALPDLGKKSSGQVKAKRRKAPAPSAGSHSPKEAPSVASCSSQGQVPEVPAPAGKPLTSGQPAIAADYTQGNFHTPEGASQQVNTVKLSPGLPPEAIAQDLDNPPYLGMGLAAMVSAAYAAETATAENHLDTGAVMEAQKVSPSPQPGNVEAGSSQSAATVTVIASDAADSINADWSAQRGQMPWLPVQQPAPATAPGAEITPANSSSLSLQPETSPASATSKQEFPPRRIVARRELTSQLPVPASNQMRPAPPPASGQASPSAAPPKPASLPPAVSTAPVNPETSLVSNLIHAGEIPPADTMPSAALSAASSPASPPERSAPALTPTATPQVSQTGSTPVEGTSLDDAAIWDYFQKMGFDSKLNMSFEEFVARKNHNVAGNTGTENICVSQPDVQENIPRSVFAEVADDMPASLLVSQLEEPEISLWTAESSLRKAAQSPLAPSRVPPAAPHKPRDILADADRQPSTRLITIKVRGYFDYQPRFTRPKQRLDEPAVAGSTTSFAKSIIGAEGPMPLEFLARRLCQKYRIQYQEQRAEEVGRCLGPSLRLVPEPGMRTVWSAEIDPLTWNTALQSPIGLPRKLGSLTLTEVANALRWQISRTNSIERSEIIGEAFKLLYGISPVTPQVVELADRAISYAIANNLLAAGDGTLWLP